MWTGWRSPTGKNPVPEKKTSWGYRYGPDKFGLASVTPVRSLDVAPPRIAECPVQREGVAQEWHPFGRKVSANAFAIHVVRLHVEEPLLTGDDLRTHIDSEKWRPLIVSFGRFFGLGGEVHPSRLAQSNFMNFGRNGTGIQSANSNGRGSNTRPLEVHPAQEHSAE